MIVSGIVYSLYYVLLMILGQQLGPQPSFVLCLFQSCLIYCAPVVLVSFSLAFLVEVFLALSHEIYGRTSASSTRTQTLLLAVPLFIYMVVFSTTLLMGLQQRETIEHDEWCLYFTQQPHLRLLLPPSLS
ncbi:hypothetical protein DFS33DRAFT_1347106 [Desarmillaria ectypa]|nr:hypothetical protein DFS33DRAFT_1347106 [Desarmillaria ectypa]